MTGLGVDIVEIERMEKILERTPSFKTRVFSQTEQDYCDAKARPAVHYASRFAAKEAVLKALGTGFLGVKVTDVEVINDSLGKPEAVLHGAALERAHALGVIEIPISLSNTHNVAVANAVAITEAHRPHIEQSVDPRAELASAFKEARVLLNEMDAKHATDEDDGDAPASSDESKNEDLA